MDSITSRPSSARNEPASDAALTRIETVRRTYFAENLTLALEQLQRTRAPPKRRTSYELYLDGYFEFQQSIDRNKSLTPTPGLTPVGPYDYPEFNENKTRSYSDDEESTTATSLTIDTPTTPPSQYADEPKVLAHTSSWGTDHDDHHHNPLPLVTKSRKRRREEDYTIGMAFDQQRTTRSRSTRRMCLWQLGVSDGRPQRVLKRQKVS